MKTRFGRRFLFVCFLPLQIVAQENWVGDSMPGVRQVPVQLCHSLGSSGQVS